jgi:hypothetical protein
MHYTGIGSRNTPEEVCKQMTQLAKHFESMGFILRSGSAGGADTAFENGVSNPINKEIYLPWKNFNGNQSSYFEISQEAFELADTLHPIFKSLKPAIQRLHARNTYQVLGNDLKTPSAFLVCYTPCGSEEESTLTSKSGGTATAIKLAYRKGVPIFNLQRHDAVNRLYEYIGRNINNIPLPLGWSRRDKINPTYEVSSVGDKRFSALYARLSDGRTIEEVYQLSVKGFETITNNWREAKGKPPINGKSFDQLYIDYKNLWILYLSENPKLLFELKARTSARYITDCFASSDVNQAKALFEIIINA